MYIQVAELRTQIWSCQHDLGNKFLCVISDIPTFGIRIFHQTFAVRKASILEDSVLHCLGQAGTCCASLLHSLGISLERQRCQLESWWLWSWYSQNGYWDLKFCWVFPVSAWESLEYLLTSTPQQLWWNRRGCHSHLAEQLPTAPRNQNGRHERTRCLWRGEALESCRLGRKPRLMGVTWILHLEYIQFLIHTGSTFVSKTPISGPSNLCSKAGKDLWNLCILLLEAGDGRMQ